jgi:hypothetical protein
MLEFAILLVLIWLCVNLWYIGITRADITDWLFLHGIRRKIK